MKNLFETLTVAFSMYSKVPTKLVEWTPENRRYTFLAFPLVGLVLGLCWFLVAFFCDWFGIPALLAGAFLTALPLLVIGGIHLDGYMDTSDALASHGDKEKKLEVMSDPHNGAFAVLHVVIYLIVWFASCTALVENGRAIQWLCVALSFVVSRCLSALAVATFPMAKGTGLVHAFAEDADKKTVRNVLLAGLLILALTYLAMDIVYSAFPVAFAIFVMAVLQFFWYRYIATKHFGGTTGDLAGWFLSKCELWMLAAAAVAVSF